MKSFTASLSKLNVLLLVALAGCGVAQEEPRANGAGAELASQGAEIINGTTDYGHPSVGTIGAPGYSFRCTGTLVGRRTVLTAAHCVNYNYEPGWFCSNGYCANGTFFKHPNYNSDNFHNDAAVLKLDMDFQAYSGIIPTRIASGSPSTGWNVNIVGFGCTEWGTSQGSGVKRQGYNVIHDVDGVTIQWDNGTSRLCQGDSGGPAFHGGDCQIGTHSFRQGFWGGRDDVATRVDTSAAWVRTIAGDSSILSCGQTICGDATCHPGENSLNCSADCQPVCGNWLCEANEPGVCVFDCPVCGDGQCHDPEYGSCTADCGPVCGNGLCEGGEELNCGGDCGMQCDMPPCPIQPGG